MMGLGSSNPVRSASQSNFSRRSSSEVKDPLGIGTLVAALATLVTARASLLAFISAPLALLTAVTLIRLKLTSAQWVEALHNGFSFRSRGGHRAGKS